MYILIRDEFFPNYGSTIQKNYQQTLQKIDNNKITKMAIFYGDNPRIKIGYIQTEIYKRLDSTYDIDTKCQFRLNPGSFNFLSTLKYLFGFTKTVKNFFEVNLTSHIYLGPDYRIKEMKINFSSSLLNLYCKGIAKRNKLELTFKKDPSQKEGNTILLPVNTMIGNPLGLSNSYPRLEVGQKIEKEWYDPITKKSRTSTLLVKSKLIYPWHGKKVSVYLLKTETSAFPSSVWIDEKGDIYQYKVLSFTFIKEPPYKIEHLNVFQRIKKKGRKENNDRN